MDIAVLTRLYETQSVSECAQTRRPLSRQDSSNKGDTVSFSDEGRALAASMGSSTQVQAATAQDAQHQGTHHGAGSFADDPRSRDGYVEPESASINGKKGLDKAEGSGGGSGSSGESGGQIEKIKAQIKQLSSQLQQVMSSSASPETKVTLGTPLQMELSSLQQELQRLEAEARQQGQAQA